MRASALPAAGRRTSTSRSPLRFIAPAGTRSPTPRSTGTLSPVSVDSSSAAPPRTIRPSSGARSPGRTRIRSPTATASTATRVSPSARTTRACFGASSISRRSAAPARPWARSSRKRPSRTNATMIAAVSKKRGDPAIASATAEATHAVPAPSPIRLSIPKARWRNAPTRARRKPRPKNQTTGVARAA